MSWRNAAPQPGGCASAVRRRRRWQCGVPPVLVQMLDRLESEILADRVSEKAAAGWHRAA
ncbi:hypothetical protein [Escherichia coli]|uniref:hypothetical protein n=1 Tax=Escherichia coli TaxID=562 RepID=UPI00399AACD9